MRGRADRTALSDVSEAPTVPPRSPECLPFNNPPLVIPGVPGFRTSLLSPATTYVVLPKENHMQLTEAATLHRKSGDTRRTCGSADLRGNVFGSQTRA
jgi:hypothetical protein